MKYVIYKQLISIILSISLVGASSSSFCAQYSFLAVPGATELKQLLIEHGFISKRETVLSFAEKQKISGEEQTAIFGPDGKKGRENRPDHFSLQRSFKGLFEYFYENKITDPTKAVTCGEIAKTLGKGYRSIIAILNGLSLHLYLLEMIEGETGKDTRYYMPEKVYDKAEEILPILSRFRGKLFYPNVITLDKIYRDKIIPIVGGELPTEAVCKRHAREGFIALSKIIAEVDDFDRKISENDFPDLKGQRLGVTDILGRVKFNPVPNFGFQWYILGFMEKGWEAVIEESGVQGGYFQFKVKLTKGKKLPVYRTFQIGRYPRKLKGQKKKKGKICKVLDIDDRLGLRGISELITIGAKHDWEEADKRGELPDLTGLKTGETTQNGTSNFSPILNYPFPWQMLGFKEKGWEGTIIGNGVVDGYFRFVFRFVLKLTKDEENPKYSIFQIGPYPRFLRGINKEKGLKKEVLNILSLEAIRRLAGKEDYKREHGRPAFDFIKEQWDVDDISQGDISETFAINELFNTANEILGRMRGENREIASQLIGGSLPESIIAEGGYSRDAVKQMLEELRKKFRSFLKDYEMGQGILRFESVEKDKMFYPERIRPCAVTFEKYAEILEQNSNRKYPVRWQRFKWSKTWMLITENVFTSIVPVLVKADTQETADFGLGCFHYAIYDSNILNPKRVDELTRERNANFFKFLEKAKKRRGGVEGKYHLFLFGGGYRNEKEKKIVQDSKAAMLKAFASVGVVDYVDFCAKEAGQMLRGVIADPGTRKVYYHYINRSEGSDLELGISEKAGRLRHDRDSGKLVHRSN